MNHLVPVFDDDSDVDRTPARWTRNRLGPVFADDFDVDRSPNGHSFSGDSDGGFIDIEWRKVSLKEASGAEATDAKITTPDEFLAENDAEGVESFVKQLAHSAILTINDKLAQIARQAARKAICINLDFRDFPYGSGADWNEVSPRLNAEIAKVFKSSGWNYPRTETYVAECRIRLTLDWPKAVQQQAHAATLKVMGVQDEEGSQ
ncbi:hypothetical protein BDZ88DRAFT_438880 [Geranomyces variabilis]|nr:hypothetical protein BDZ88DRAFT_438880 [Geranomyces variabilis]KAJ3135249.1 hypothetical protein HDU90_003972 [Geranomyces variabilis]